MNIASSNTVYGQFSEAAHEGPELPFLCYPSSPTRSYMPDGCELSYGHGLTIVDDLAARYRDAGYGHGHRVALIAGNRPEHFWHFLALNSIGVCVVTLNPEYRPHELAYGIDFPKCSAVVAVDPWIANVEEVAQTLVPAVPVIDASALPARYPPPARAPDPVGADKSEWPALIIYTSGTTGRPKGCIISNASCLAAANSYTDAGGLLDLVQRKERIYIPLPAFHMNVSVYTLNTITKIRGCLIMQDRFTVSRWWSDIRETRATGFHYMGIIPPLLLKSAPVEDDKRHNLKFGQGAGVDPLVREAFEERFGVPLIEAWGMTETSRAIQNSHTPRCLEPRAFGRPGPPLEVRIVDESDRQLPLNTPGELTIRAAGDDPRRGFFSGYLNQPDETEHAWRGGWFHTGDIVTQRVDGMLFFVDRLKNIIRRSGENIAAAEIEEALHILPQVKSAAAMAVPDEFHDEEIMACVVLMPGVEPTVETATALLFATRQTLADFKVPAWISFVDTIPVTGTQKVQKGQIFDVGQDPRADRRSHDLRAVKRQLKLSSSNTTGPTGNAGVA
ncbi:MULTISPECIES: AMP-binding protein [Paraburkholderia]|uniref:AMP-binding protein n=1 Tax=Paraburkholderia madseniana TaxID=2599607 RepID=A0AAP5BKR4_9BURK|nr:MULTISPECIES: AMP-binding protein [Paraburkholderia]MCX4149949.1 AMP-binding protein [Paraburkholderia madseniana]MDN7152885.1 AMP-binding protein [Paraburkholderia sp. WS6]MDQ6411767.1 AMP-binding protein [Paraburkholderia madseniana]